MIGKIIFISCVAIVMIWAFKGFVLDKYKKVNKEEENIYHK